MKTKVIFLYFLTLLCPFKTLLAPQPKFEIDENKLEEQIDEFYQEYCFKDFGNTRYDSFKKIVKLSLNPNEVVSTKYFDEDCSLGKIYYFDYLKCKFYHSHHFKSLEDNLLITHIVLFLVKYYPSLQNPSYQRKFLEKLYYLYKQKESLSNSNKEVLSQASKLLLENSVKSGMKIKDRRDTYTHYDRSYYYYIEILKLLNPEKEIDYYKDFWRDNFNQIIFDQKTLLDKVKHYWGYLPNSDDYLHFMDEDLTYIKGLIIIIARHSNQDPQLLTGEIDLQDPVVIPDFRVQEEILKTIVYPTRIEEVKDILETEDENGFCKIDFSPDWAIEYTEDIEDIDTRILNIMLQAFEKIESTQECTDEN